MSQDLDRSAPDNSHKQVATFWEAAQKARETRRKIVQRRLDVALAVLDLRLAQLQRLVSASSITQESDRRSQPEDGLLSKMKEPEYSTLVALAMFGQQNKWQTFNMFVIFQSVLFVLWISLLNRLTTTESPQFSFMIAKLQISIGNAGAQQIPWTIPSLVLLGIPIIGSATALLWSILGKDYAEASDLFANLAVEHEKRFLGDIRPFTGRADQRRSKGQLATSRFILVVLPAVVGFLWLAILGVWVVQSGIL